MPSKAGRCSEESAAAAGSRGIEHRRSGRGGICVHDGEIDAGPSGLSPLFGAADGHCEKEEAVGSPELTFAKTARIDRIREKALSRADSAGIQFKRISAVGQKTEVEVLGNSNQRPKRRSKRLGPDCESASRGFVDYCAVRAVWTDPTRIGHYLKRVPVAMAQPFR